MSNDFCATIAHRGDAPYFVFVDHATNAMPEEFHSLGLPEDILETHIAYDIGAGELGTTLARILNGTCFCCDYSRLIMDPNRDPGSHDSIPAVSDLIPIPGNEGIDDDERKRRLEVFHEPYHARLAAEVDALHKTHPTLFAISVHSFSRRLMGDYRDRPWHIGFLWRHDPTNARAFIEWLSGHTDYCLGDNEPYDARAFNYSVDRHIGARKIPHITLEVRQDLLSNSAEIARIADILARGVRCLVEK